MNLVLLPAILSASPELHCRWVRGICVLAPNEEVNVCDAVEIHIEAAARKHRQLKEKVKLSFFVPLRSGLAFKAPRLGQAYAMARQSGCAGGRWRHSCSGSEGGQRTQQLAALCQECGSARDQ